ncbi:MAG TPA: 50S ribosomal protein L25/general stress protein Ctc [Thermopetrobacter sp.]|nr:50S ribosomal protein L25/general stress protein Ctc [Thermopetrobacter sp.]
MPEIVKMKATRRAKSGKGAARRERRAGRVPAVLYGDDKAPEPISVDFVEVLKQINRGRFESRLVELDVDGEVTRTIPRDVQLDPVKDLPVHVDFLRLGKGARITVEVPVEYVNEEASPGLKRGGALNVVRHVVEVWCRASQIPERITVDLSGLEIGDSVHISDVDLPDGVEPTITDRDFTLCTIAGAVAEEAAEAEEEAEDAPEAGEADDGEKDAE